MAPILHKPRHEASPRGAGGPRSPKGHPRRSSHHSLAPGWPRCPQPHQQPLTPSQSRPFALSAADPGQQPSVLIPSQRARPISRDLGGSKFLLIAHGSGGILSKEPQKCSIPWGLHGNGPTPPLSWAWPQVRGWRAHVAGEVFSRLADTCPAAPSCGCEDLRTLGLGGLSWELELRAKRAAELPGSTGQGQP